MKTKNTWMVMGVAMALFSACKKDNLHSLQNPPDSYPELKVGNYWVYEVYEVDTANVATSLGILDSSYVEKDTVINGHTYFKKIESNYPFSASHAVYLRDSIGYIVNHKGTIVFTMVEGDFN